METSCGVVSLAIDNIIFGGANPKGSSGFALICGDFACESG